MRFPRYLALISVLVLVMASIAFAAPSQTKGSYLVGFHPGKADKALGNGVEVVSEWPDIHAVSIKATAQAAEALKKNPNVEYVEEDEPRHKMGFTDGTYTWGLDAVNAPEAWAMGATGAGIKVCVLDTGIDDTHPAFYRNGVSIIKAKMDFTRSKTGTFDVDGHGTHTAGTVAGQGNGPGSYFGTAPGVDLYIAKVLGDDGSGSTTGILNGVKWCAETVGAQILSMSLGGGRPSKTEDRAYTKYYNAGKLIIAAAGNDENNTTSYPAGYASVVSVAAVDENLAHASFSQWNADVEIAAPGVGTLSGAPQGTGRQAAASEAGTAYTAHAVEFAALGTVAAPLVECGLADTTTSCQNPPAGTWIAMINRGTITFADKVTNVMAQGAAAAIIANNDTAAPDNADSFTLGAAGNWIPTVSVSYNSGMAIRAGGLSTGTVSLTAWDYAYNNGTSMATPHVSGVAALAWSAKPALTGATIRSILTATAADLGAAGRDDYFGHGLVQADAAVTMALTK
ncbi:MAG TPA: S8 family serine peptidase [Symbiobacteriaceae bacterium]|nr:S8 family serine peptidase [Symbiobacteriaceae bacterium]